VISVVTVLHDSAAHVDALLDSIPDGVEVIVVDTDSADDGPARARSHGATVVELGRNPGFGAANNAGLGVARGDVTVLLNPDCVVLGDALEQLAGEARGRDALHVPRLLNPDGSVQHSAHPLPGTHGALLPALVHPPLLPRALRDRVEPWRSDTPRTVGWAIAACVAARTATLRRLGPFDPEQFLFYEDLDLCLRARAAGIPTVLHPGIEVRHAGGHATGRAYGGEPHALLARRRREVVAANLGPAALRRDERAQRFTFATRALARRPRALEQWRAQRQNEKRTP
jgi:GT2 family glycosyltransferase